MTEKQESILKAALELFARDGYHAVSTSKVAKQANVSEALIFRHFENKEGLLKAVLEEGSNQAKVVFGDILMTGEPKEIIRKVLEMTFKIPTSEYEYWRLIYALKWQQQQYNKDMVLPLKLLLIDAFKKLQYSQPEAEAELILMLIDGAAMALLLQEPKDRTAVLKALKAKYDIA